MYTSHNFKRKMNEIKGIFVLKRNLLCCPLHFCRFDDFMQYIGFESLDKKSCYMPRFQRIESGKCGSVDFLLL